MLQLRSQAAKNSLLRLLFLLRKEMDLMMSDIKRDSVGCMDDDSVWGDDSASVESTDPRAKYSVNPIIWKPVPGSSYPGELMPYLMFAPHCESCGKPVEAYEGVPVGCIYPEQRFLCSECEDLDWGYFLYARHRLLSGEWSDEQFDAFLMSLIDDGPYYF
jgi:hypothetical protein